MSNLYNNERSVLLVQSVPVIKDPKELHTILVFSLRSLWGDLESHSGDIRVLKSRQSTDIFLLEVHCRSESVPAVRSALTLVTTPSYLDDVLYRFDVLDVQEEEEESSATERNNLHDPKTSVSYT